MMLTIYGTPLSSPSNKVRYVANYLQIPYDYQLVNLATGEQHQPDFLSINPAGKVPAIVDDGFKLCESNAIIRYLATKTQSNVYPSDLQARAIVDQWLDFAAQQVALATSKIMFNTHFFQLAGIEQDKRSLQDGREFISKYLTVVEGQLEKTPYIAGQTLSLADFALLSALDVCEVCNINITTFPKTVAWQTKLMNEKFFTDCHKSYKTTFDEILAQFASA